MKEALEEPEVRDWIRARIVEMLPPPPDPVELLVDSRAAAKALGMSPAAFRMVVYRGTIPCEKIGRRLRFRPSVLRGR